MKQEITVQDADFKNKTKAVKNRKKISSRSRIPLEDKKKIIS
jgi:hypothetical protein